MAIVISGYEIGSLGQEICKTRLRKVLDTPENIGKIVSIDAASADYELADDLVVAGRNLQKRRPMAQMYGRRIGYGAVYALSRSLVPDAEW